MNLILALAIHFWLAMAVGPAAAASADMAAADALLSGPRWGEAQARQALSLYEQQLLATAEAPMALLVRLARTAFIVGDLADGKEVPRRMYEKGIEWSEQIIQHYANRVEGHYWRGLHMAGLASVVGKARALQLLPRILQDLERATALDAAYDQAGAHRVLGRIYYEAPGWPLSVGDVNKSLQHLSTSVRLAPDNTTNHLYLAETLLRLDRRAQAKIELERVLSATRHAVWPQGVADDQAAARRLLRELTDAPSSSGP